jgi:hypothetical protein
LEVFLEKLTTVYGPLALGWLFFWLSWRDGREKDRKLTDAYLANATAFATLKQFIEERLPPPPRRR